MRFALDIVFLDSDGHALRTVRGVGPRRVVRHRGAEAVVERLARPSPPAREPVAQRLERQVLRHVHLQRQAGLLAALGGLAQPARIARRGRRGRARRRGRGRAPPPRLPRPRTPGRGSPAPPASGPARAAPCGRGGRRAWPSRRSAAPALRARGPWARTEAARRAPRPRSSRPASRRSSARASRPRHGSGSSAPAPPPASAGASIRSTSARRPRPPPTRGARALAAAERQPRARPARSAGTPSLVERCLDPLGGQRIEAHELAARHHRGDHLRQRVGEQDQVDEGGRLLERLEQPVGHLVVHGVHPLEHEHAAAWTRTACGWRRPPRARPRPRCASRARRWAAPR